MGVCLLLLSEQSVYKGLTPPHGGGLSPQNNHYEELSGSLQYSPILFLQASKRRNSFLVLGEEHSPEKH